MAHKHDGEVTGESRKARRARQRRRIIAKMPQDVRALTNDQLRDELNHYAFQMTGERMKDWYFRPKRRLVIQEAYRRGILRSDPGIEGGDLKYEP